MGKRGSRSATILTALLPPSRKSVYQGEDLKQYPTQKPVAVILPAQMES